MSAGHFTNDNRPGDRALRDRQGANARRLAEDVFARDRLAGRFTALLEHLAGTPRNANRTLPIELREPLVPRPRGERAGARGPAADDAEPTPAPAAP